MAVVRLTSDFAGEVSAFRAAGDEIDAYGVSEPSASDLSLPTVKAYDKRMFEIRKIMTAFRLLTIKDAKEMDELAASLTAADQAGC